MPFVKIVEKGFGKFNGMLEGVQFNDGVSEEPLSEASAERIGAFMKIVDADDPDRRLGIGYRIAEARKQGKAPRKPLEWVQRTKTGKEKKPIKKQAKTVNYDFTKEQLEDIADKGGIQDLRKVAEQYDVRGRSIAEIIDSLMALKANQEAKEAAAAPKGKEVDSKAGGDADESDTPDTGDIDSLIED